MPLAAVLLTAAALSSSATGLPAAEAPDLGQLATCQQSWLDWKEDDLRMSQYAAGFESHFTRIEEEPAFLPRVPGEVLGFRLVKVYPQSVGMGVGFSLVLDGKLADMRREVEKRLGKPLTCSSGDGMTACDLELGENRTVMLTGPGDGTDAVNLLGCYYYYEQ